MAQRRLSPLAPSTVPLPPPITSSPFQKRLTLKDVPQDVLYTIMSNLHPKSIGRLSQTGKTFNIFANEQRWINLFVQISSNHRTDNHMIPLELAQTWRERTLLLWKLMYPHQIITAIRHITPYDYGRYLDFDSQSDDSDDSDDSEQESDMYHVKREENSCSAIILGNFWSSDVDEIKRLILQDYSERQGPIYSKIGPYMNDSIEFLEQYHSDISTNFLQDALNGDIDLFKIIKKHYDGDLPIVFEQNPYFEFDSDMSKTYNIYCFEGYPSFTKSINTFTVPSKSYLYQLITVILNYKHIFAKLNHFRVLIELIERIYSSIGNITHVYTSKDIINVLSMSQGRICILRGQFM